MKRTLRVLFLAVLAMTLMASVAFAATEKVPFSKSSFDVVSIDKTEVILDATNKSATVTVAVNLSKDNVLNQAVSYDKKYVTAKVEVNAGTTSVNGKTVSKDVKVTITLVEGVTEGNTTVKLTLSSGDKESSDIEISVKIGGSSAPTSPDIKSISVVSSSVTVAVGGTANVTATITVSPDKTNSYVLTSKDITVTPKTSGIVTVVVGTPKSTDKGMKFTVPLTVTGAKAGSTDITVEVNNKTKFNSVEAKGTFKATVTEGGGGSTSTFSWSNTEDLQEADVVLYVDSKGEVVVSKDFAVTLKVPSDYDSSTVTFVVLDEDGEEYAFDNWEVTDDGGSETDSTDIYEYVLTFIPSASQDKASYTMYATVDDEDGNTVSTDTIAFTVAVLVSSDATTEDTTYTLKMEDLEYTEKEIKQGEKVTVKIAVTPMRATGTYTFTCEANDSNTFTVDEADEDQDTSAQTNYVEYTLQAGLDEEPGDYTFTFTVTSGDEQTVSAEVTFTVTDVEDYLDSLTPSQRKSWLTSNRAPAPETPTPSISNGVWTFRLVYPYPVHPRGWLLGFYSGSTFDTFVKVLYELMRCLVNGNTSNESALISVLGMIAEESNAGGIQTDAATDSKSAEYTMDQADVEDNLDSGTYGVRPRVIPAKYAQYIDGTVTSDDAASEPTESIGTVEGAGSGGGGGSTDEILPGSSGGCDAGFGTLALALAATLFLSKKRS